jgi:hypothetical protein
MARCSQGRRRQGQALAAKVAPTAATAALAVESRAGGGRCTHVSESEVEREAATQIERELHALALLGGILGSAVPGHGFGILNGRLVEERWRRLRRRCRLVYWRRMDKNDIVTIAAVGNDDLEFLTLVLDDEGIAWLQSARNHDLQRRRLRRRQLHSEDITLHQAVRDDGRMDVARLI